MKILFLGFVFIIITLSARAQELRGQVKLFSGRSVETNRPYSYYALFTADQERIILPAWIDSKKIALETNHEMILEGAIQYNPCTDMSEACPTGQIKKVRWLQYQNPNEISSEQIYTGMIKRFKGREIESNRAYDFIALEAGQERIEVPLIFDQRRLHQLNPRVSLQAKLLLVACSDATIACGPHKLQSYSMIKLEF